MITAFVNFSKGRNLRAKVASDSKIHADGKTREECLTKLTEKLANKFNTDVSNVKIKIC
jgi:hypothetical protein